MNPIQAIGVVLISSSVFIVSVLWLLEYRDMRRERHNDRARDRWRASVRPSRRSYCERHTVESYWPDWEPDRDDTQSPPTSA